MEGVLGSSISSVSPLRVQCAACIEAFAWPPLYDAQQLDGEENSEKANDNGDCSILHSQQAKKKCCAF